MTAELKEEKRFIEAGQIKFWQRVFNLMKNKFLRLCDSKFVNGSSHLWACTNGIGYNDKSLRVLLVRHRGRSRVFHVAALGLNLSTGFFGMGGPKIPDFVLSVQTRSPRLPFR